MFQPWVAADELRAMRDQRMLSSDLEMSITPMGTVILGDYAHTVGMYPQVFTPKAGSSPLGRARTGSACT